MRRSPQPRRRARSAVERPRRGDLHVGHDRRNPHRRSVQRKRRKRSHESILGSDAVDLHQRITLRLRLVMAVSHPLGGAGGSRGEDDRCEIVRTSELAARRVQLPTLAARRASLQTPSARRAARGDRRDGDAPSGPPHRSCGSQRRGDADEIVRSGDSPGPSHAAHAEPASATTATAPIRQHA